MQGCEWLVVDRQNILMTTKTGLEKKDLHKELKIKFSDEKVEDAGGLLREWMHLTVKEIFDPEQNGNLLLCDSDEVAYRFRTGQNPNEQEVGEEIFRTLGIIIGKALLEKVSLNCFLDRTIWRIVCNQPIQLEDIASFDREVRPTRLSCIEIGAT